MLQYLEYLHYSLRDLLHFAPRTYYRLFELYNAEIWPAQVLALALGIAILALLRRGVAGHGAWQARAVASILALAWLWVAWAFLYRRLATIHLGGHWIAAGFALQALLLGWVGVVRGRLRLRLPARPEGWVGLGVFLFALLVQPMVGPLVFGRPWTQVELFGVAPDPTAVATLGLLPLAAGRASWVVLALPAIWCAVSGATLWAMQSPDWPVAPLAALVALLLAARGAAKLPTSHGAG